MWGEITFPNVNGAAFDGWKGYVISSQYLLGMQLFIHAGI